MASARNKIAKSKATRERLKTIAADRRPVVEPRVKGGKPKTTPGILAQVLKAMGKPAGPTRIGRQTSPHRESRP